LVKIVAMPPGTRPLRLPMGGPPGVLESINHEMGRVQRSLLEQMQLDGLLKR